MSDSGTKKSQGEQDPEKPVKRKKKMSKKKKLATALLILLALLVIIAGVFMQWDIITIQRPTI